MFIMLQLKEREAEILSLSTTIEALILRNNELEENHCSQLYEAKTQVTCWFNLLMMHSFKQPVM